MTPKTAYEVLQLLKNYHRQRRETYQQLAQSGSDEQARLLLDQLVVLEEQAITVISGELELLDPARSPHLMPGPTLTIEPAHAMDCRCGSDPSFDDALRCALTSDAALDELVDQLAASSAAQSVQDLASRLRELERTKDRQIAKFTRED